MHVLVTADTLSGVWTYARELVTGLVSRNIRVTLVSVGEIPLPHETSWMDNLHGLEYIPTAFRLDWMQEGEEDLKDSSQYLANLIHDIKPDILHLNQMCYGNLPVSTPRIVVAHSDWIGWWKAVHGCDPKETRWLGWYREALTRGILGAGAVVAPSRWMLETVNDSYAEAGHQEVIYNGRNPIFFNPYISKEESVLAIGRLWDAGRQVSLLTQHEHPLPVCIVGADPATQTPQLPIRADVKLSIDQVKVAFKGPQTEAQMRTLYSKAAIYAATSRYEPFSMTALEAALSRCAIVANDIPSLREMWGETAFYFHSNNAASLADAIRRLSEQPDLCRHYATLAYQRARDRFTAKRMIDEYLSLYHRLITRKSAAA
jgi:glycogen synthase